MKFLSKSYEWTGWVRLKEEIENKKEDNIKFLFEREAS